MAEKLTGKCPHCGSTNLSTEPVYPEGDELEYADEQEEEGTNPEVAVFCVTCGHYLGVTESSLRGASHELHSDLIKQIYVKPAAE